jgi:hypothetical protein
MWAKARFLDRQGKTAEAIAAGERALVLGKEATANVSAANLAALEKSLAGWKAKK